MSTALIVVDYQHDFAHPDGALYVPGGETLAPKIEKLSERYSRVILTQDWHSPTDPSFKKQGGSWPPHCIAGSPGTEFFNIPLTNARAMYIARKVYNSAFGETGFAHLLRGLDIDKIHLCGLALDYCVFETAVGAVFEGFDTSVILEVTKGITTEHETCSSLKSIGVIIL